MDNEIKRNNNIELYSEEVQEIMSKNPFWILRYGVIILLLIILTLVVGSWFYKYPDIIKVNVIITSTNPPVTITARLTGNIDKIFVRNNQIVKAQTPLAVLHNTAKNEDILKLIALLNQWQTKRDRNIINKQFISGQYLSLGSIQPYYATFVNSLNDYNNYLAVKNCSQRRAIKYQLSVKNAYEALIAQINVWKQSYLMITPIEGIVNQIGVCRNNQNVNTGEALFTIMPLHQTCPEGKAFLPINGAGKVKIGQRVNVHINNFPDQEFGYLIGKIKSISNILNKDGYYVVEIEFPNGLVTSYGNSLPTTQQMMGTADIITADLRLIERFFMPVKKLLSTNG